MKKIIIILAVLIVVGVGTYYIISKNATQPQASPASEDSVTVNIQNYTFNPATITVKPGTKVTWINNDGVVHTVTALSEAGPSSGALNRGDTFSYIFNVAGTFEYKCSPHPSMRGAVIVVSQ